MNPSPEPRAAPRIPPSDRLCDGAIAAFAIWTIVCHAAVARGGTLDQAILAYAVAAAVCLASVLWLRHRAPLEARADVTPEAIAGESGGALRRSLPALGAVIGAGASLTLLRGTGVETWWWITVTLLLGATAVFVLGEEPRWRTPARSTRLSAGLGALALACVAVTLVAHRPDIDDAFYVNAAVAAADQPDRPLLSGDTLHGVTDLPLHMPAHRLHSWELWNAAISRITGIPAIAVFHLLSAALVAVLAVLAHARLFRLLVPAHWLAATLAWVVVLLAVGETHRWYGNFAFLRMWQGKALFLFVFLPLVAVHAIRFARRPQATPWLLLAGAQVAAVGASSSAIWAAPACALTALCVGLRASPRSLVTLGIGASASVYVVAAGVLLKADMMPIVTEQLEPHATGEQLRYALETVLGDGWVRTAGVSAVATAWAFATGMARRFAIVFPLAVLLVLLTPYTDAWVAKNVTGPSTWRAMWSLPIPILLSLILVSPLRLAGSSLRLALGRGGFALALAAFVLFVPQFGAFSSENAGAGGVGIWLGRPGLRVPQEPHRWAELLNESVPPGSVVAAPLEISVWVPTFHQHAHPLVVRPMYLRALRQRDGDSDADDRVRITAFVGGDPRVRGASDLFQDGLERYDVRGVCLRVGAGAGPARSVLRNAGFLRKLPGEHYEIWVRP